MSRKSVRSIEPSSLRRHTECTAWNIRVRGRGRSEKTKKTHSTKWSLFFSRLTESPSYFARSSSLDLSECPFRCRSRPLRNRRDRVTQKHCGYILTKRNAVYMYVCDHPSLFLFRTRVALNRLSVLSIIFPSCLEHDALYITLSLSLFVSLQLDVICIIESIHARGVQVLIIVFVDVNKQNWLLLILINLKE